MSLFFFIVNKIIVAAAIGPIPSSMDFITIVNPYGKVILLYQSNSPSLNTPDNIVGNGLRAGARNPLLRLRQGNIA